MRDVELEIECAARSGAKVLITGESSVGKEVVAHLIRQSSDRSHRLLVTIKSPAFRKRSLESELFGHVRDSFGRYEPFVSRDLTREDLRAIIARGLEQTKGNYKLLIMLFNLPPGDYERVLNFLRKYDCHMPFQPFRSVPAQLGGGAWTEARVGARRSSFGRSW